MSGRHLIKLRADLIRHNFMERIAQPHNIGMLRIRSDAGSKDHWAFEIPNKKLRLSLMR